jgi:hypothetical protein
MCDHRSDRIRYLAENRGLLGTSEPWGKRQYNQCGNAGVLHGSTLRLRSRFGQIGNDNRRYREESGSVPILGGLFMVTGFIVNYRETRRADTLPLLGACISKCTTGERMVISSMYTVYLPGLLRS